MTTTVCQKGAEPTHLGASSVRFEIGVVRDDDELAAAQGHFVHVCCDRATFRPMPMPDDMRRTLAALMR